MAYTAARLLIEEDVNAAAKAPGRQRSYLPSEVSSASMSGDEPEPHFHQNPCRAEQTSDLASELAVGLKTSGLGGCRVAFTRKARHMGDEQSGKWRET
jgi:hypothetical protein